MSETVLEIRNLKTHFSTRNGLVKAVDGVSFDMQKGKTLGIVGESGCGKSVTALSILKIVPWPGEITAGSIKLYPDSDSEVDIITLPTNGPEVRQIRGGDIGFVFQEPMTSLSPVYTIGNQICENILLHEDVTKNEARTRALNLLDQVGIPRGEILIDEYSFQLSGGMRQRAMIALSIACNPSILIADEPTTAIDVTIQARVLDLLSRLRNENNMSILMITHDLGVIAETSDHVAVMYLGKIVETSATVELFDNPLHPYTSSLLRSIPDVSKKPSGNLRIIKGSVPGPYAEIPGCPFSTRCEDFIVGVCDAEMPALVETAPGHAVACYLHNDTTEHDE